MLQIAHLFVKLIDVFSVVSRQECYYIKYVHSADNLLDTL
jgi:hypothetical protein